MSRWLKLLPLLLALFWLPMFSVAAAAMPPCAHQHHDHDQPASHFGHGSHQQHEGDHGHHDAHHDPHDHDATESEGVAHVPCDACGYCHLACAGLIPAGSLSRLSVLPADPPAVPPALTFRSHPAEPLPRPPRRT